MNALVLVVISSLGVTKEYIQRLYRRAKIVARLHACLVAHCHRCFSLLDGSGQCCILLFLIASLSSGRHRHISTIGLGSHDIDFLCSHLIGKCEGELVGAIEQGIVSLGIHLEA